MSIRKQIIAVAFAVLVLATMACGGFGGDASGPSGSGDTMFEDDFSDPGTGWEVGDYDTGSVGYRDGSYFVTSLGYGDTMWGVASTSFRDIDITVDATQITAGPEDNNDYGIACRVQNDGSGYYLLISGDGGFAILKGYEEGYETLVDWTATDAVRQGNANNSIRAVCDGSTITLYANGKRLATADDTTFSNGDIALTATSYEDVLTEIHFDNIVVTKP
jgi:hypothetical protein